MKNNGLSLPIIMGIVITMILLVMIIFYISNKGDKTVVSNNDTSVTTINTTNIEVTSQDVLENEVITTIETTQQTSQDTTIQESISLSIQESDGTVQDINIHNDGGEVNPNFNIVVNGSQIVVTTNNINKDDEVYNIEIN
ncbi:MAG: hypothetical protein ACI4WH_05430 [Oscillospiraceae bacterium]